MSNGKFILSLDFELHWGVMPNRSVKDYEKNLKGTRLAVDGILKLFTIYGVHCTWATVGFLFYDSKEHLMSDLHKVKKPTYEDTNFDSYKIIPQIGASECIDPYHYASAVIHKIKETSHQEIATHTYSHFFCLEDGQNAEQFESDLQQAIKIAKITNIELSSIVFPRNQYNDYYLQICRDYGITAVRTNPKGYMYKPRTRTNESVLVRTLRFMDAYINLSGNQVSDIEKSDSMYILKASRFLRPYSNALSWLEWLKIRRIKIEMTYAAKMGRVYHLWWHPHNFGINTTENLKMLESILEHFQKLRNEYGFNSINMKDATRL